MNTRLTSGCAALMRRSMRVTACSTSDAVPLSRKSRLSATSTSCGTKMHTEDFIRARDGRLCRGNRMDARLHLGGDTFTGEQRRALEGQKSGGAGQDDADQERGNTVERRQVEILPEKKADQRHEKAEHCGRI